VAVFAKRNAGVLPMLLDVVGIAGPWRIADRARQRFDALKMLVLLEADLVVHDLLPMS